MHATISAIQNAYQLCEMSEISMKIQRQGTSNISWRIAALIILNSIRGTAIVYSKGQIGLSASLFLEFISPPYGIAKKM